MAHAGDNMSQVYWLIELRTKPVHTVCYYTTPRTWGSAVDLATKFHTKAAADAEIEFLKIPDSPHEMVAVDHVWC
jgi:hypothetical protein